MPHRGLRVTSLPRPWEAKRDLVKGLYVGQAVPEGIVTYKTPPLVARNQQLVALFLDGVRVAELAEQFGISEQRVWQIIQSHRNS